jgi:mRNA interferase MazF
MNTMAKPRDVVVVDFAGATLTKRRPAIVLSNDTYHKERPDVIVGLVTTNLAAATSSSDYTLQDWRQAGLRSASAFRTYLGMESPANIHVIGHLSDRDWQGVLAAVRRAIG